MKQFFLPLIFLLTLALLAGCAAPAAEKTPETPEEAPASASAPAQEAPDDTQDSAPADNVTIAFDGGSVSVDGAGKDTVKTEGANVTIRQPGAYVLSGKSDSGSVKIKKDTGHVTLILRNLALTADGTAAICCNKGSSLSIVAEAGTVNTLADGQGGEQKAAIYCKGHLELKGKGTLNVSGNTAHAIKSGDYTSVKNCTVNILSAVKDGISVN